MDVAHTDSITSLRMAEYCCKVGVDVNPLFTRVLTSCVPLKKLTFHSFCLQIKTQAYNLSKLSLVKLLHRTEQMIIED